MKRLSAEFTGTFCLVFCGTGAAIVNQQTHGALGGAGVSVVFGLIVIAMIFSFCKTSGAHINPAVTVAFAIAGLHEWRRVFSYLLAQTMGALLASGLLKLLFPASETLGATLPSGTVWQSLVLEIVLSFILMLVILKTATGDKETGTNAALAIGGTVALEALFGGPISGASMNPARSLAPALVSGHLEHLWVYLTAPLIGSIGAVLYCRMDRA